jgi:hypothetical protein
MFVTLLNSAVSFLECLFQTTNLRHLSMPLEASFDLRKGKEIDDKDIAVLGCDENRKCRGFVLSSAF